MSRVAVLGTGKMGSALAQRLDQCGHTLTLWNRTRSKAEALEVGTVARNPAQAVADAEFVISSLTGPVAVHAAYLGPDGAFSELRQQHFIEMSTTGPGVLEELAERVRDSAATLIDAPIIGAPPAARSGAALVVAGGAADAVEQARPLLELFGELRHVGATGSGQRLKLVNNSMLGAITFASGELQMAGEASGLDPEVVFGVLVRLVPVLDARRVGYLEDRHQPLFAVRDLYKDLDLALGLWHESRARVPVTTQARELVGEAMAQEADLDISAVIHRFRTS